MRVGCGKSESERWKNEATEDSPPRRNGRSTTAALQQVDSRGKSQPDAQTARLVAELERMRRVVAEITAENLELKKKL